MALDSVVQNRQISTVDRSVGHVTPAERFAVDNPRIKVADWKDILSRGDVNKAWSELHRIVSSHPLVRASKRAGFLVEEGRPSAYEDLTQELFVVLLSKNRFQNYQNREMTNREIEGEISQIELTNLLTAELRKRYPESYRIARRISTIVQTSEEFRRFDNINCPEAHLRLANRKYGLTEWQDGKETAELQILDEKVKEIPFYSRDTRMVGCTGDAQIVISNPELKSLIVKVFEKINSPVDIRSLRALVMSRLPIMDICLVPVENNDRDSNDERMPIVLVDRGETPIEGLIRKEEEFLVSDPVDGFIKSLNRSVRGKEKQFNRLIKILYACYLGGFDGTQLEVASSLGVSDSLVSDYRKRIEVNLEQLSKYFSNINEARSFEAALKEKVRDLLASTEPIQDRTSNEAKQYTAVL